MDSYVEFWCMILNLFIFSHMSNFDGIDLNSLGVDDVDKINVMTPDPKHNYVFKVIKVCQYLFNLAIQQERQDGIIHCVWNIQF
jgi:hypothetical protein